MSRLLGLVSGGMIRATVWFWAVAICIAAIIVVPAPAEDASLQGYWLGFGKVPNPIPLDLRITGKDVAGNYFVNWNLRGRPKMWGFALGAVAGNHLTFTFRNGTSVVLDRVGPDQLSGKLTLKDGQVTLVNFERKSPDWKQHSDSGQGCELATFGRSGNSSGTIHLRDGEAFNAAQSGTSIYCIGGELNRAP